MSELDIAKLEEILAVNEKHLRLRKRNLVDAIGAGHYDDTYIGYLRKLCEASVQEQKDLRKELLLVCLKTGIKSRKL